MSWLRISTRYVKVRIKPFTKATHNVLYLEICKISNSMVILVVLNVLLI